MEQNLNAYSTVTEVVHESIYDDNLRVKDQNSLYLSNLSKTPSSALRDLNNVTKERLSAIENAQRKWVEDIRNWSTTDEVQKAQLEWIHKFSSVPSFNVINSPEKKRDSPWTLPFSPPKSSYDTSPRRGYCVYEPGTRDVNRRVSQNVNENRNDVKVAQLAEPTKVNATEKTVLSTRFSPFTEAKSNKIDKTAKKRHITVRKKLQCLKKLEQNEAARDKQNKESTPKTGNTPEKSEEDRRAARRYIQRKRVERDRQLREQREQEERAEQERRARMERLRETQHRIIFNSAKKQPKQQHQEQKKEGWIDLINNEKEEDKPISREMVQPPEYTGAHITGAIPFVSSRGKQNSSEDLKEIPHTPIGAGFSWTQDENIPPPEENLHLETRTLDHNPVIGTYLLSTLGSPSSVKVNSLSDVGPSIELTPIRLKSHSLQKLMTPPLSSTPICCKLTSSESVIPLSSLVNSDNFNSIETQNQPSLIHDIDHRVQLNEIVEDEDLMKTISFGSEPQRKEYGRSEDKPNSMLKNFSFFTSSGNIPSNNSQYNLFAAISNKRSAFKELENESQKKQPKIFSMNENAFRPSVLNKSNNEITNSEWREVSEKGVQCEVERDNVKAYSSRSTSDQFYSSSSRSEVKLTQSEQLRKPNLILLPGRLSDPCIYSKRKVSTPEVHMDTTVSDNLSVDPLNVSPNLSLIHQRVVDQNITPQLLKLPHESSVVKLSSSQLKLSSELDERPSAFDGNIGALEVITHVKNYQIVNQNTFQHDAVRALEIDSMLPKGGDVNIGRIITDDVDKLNLFDGCLNKNGYEEHNSGQKRDLSKLSLEEDIDSVVKKSVTSDISLVSSRDNSLLKSTSPLQFDLQGNNFSFINFAKFSLNMFIDLLKEETLRSRQQESHFKMREHSIIDKTKAEIAYLELEKKKFKVMGNEDGVRNTRKKIRGLIMKLQQNLEDLQLVKKMEKSAYRGRRKLLLQKIDLMKDQLKKQMVGERKDNKELSKDTSSSSLDTNKETVKDLSVISFETKSYESKGSSPFSLEKQKRDKENEEELGTTLKQKITEGEKRIQELEALIKGPTLIDTDTNSRMMVERGTSPLRSSSDDDRKKGDCSYSDTLDQLSTSTQHDKLEDKDARKMIALKIPLSPRVTLKRRHSSGSDESLLLSQTETQSDASDMETRVLALQQQLKQRKAELESLHREYKKSQRERLIAKEQSLLSQIQAYDVYIGQVKKELEKERDGSEVKMVKPVIKHPKLSCERRKSDTWLLQDRKCLRNCATADSDNINETNKSEKNKDRQCTKNDKGNKLLDNQALEKFNLKADFLSSLVDCGQPEIANQVVNSGAQLSQKFDDKGISIARKIIESEKSRVNERLIADLEVNSITQFPSSGYVSTFEEDRKLSKLVELDKSNDGTCSLKNTINKKINLDEKFCETSVSSMESNNDVVISESKSKMSLLSVKSFITEQKENCSENKSLSVARDMHLEDIKNDGTDLKSNSISDISMKEGYSRTSISKTKVSNESENYQINYNPTMEEKVAMLIKGSEDEWMKLSSFSAASAESPEEAEPIKTEEASIINENTSVIVTEIEENISKDISTKNVSGVSDRYINSGQSDNIENVTEESVKEITELLSEAPSSIVKSDDMSGSNEEESDNSVSLNPDNPMNTSHKSMSCEEISPKEEILRKTTDFEIEISEQLEESIQKSLTKNDSTIEEVNTLNESDSLSSGTFPLPIFNKDQIKNSIEKENSISNEDSIVKDITNTQLNIESEIESVLSEVLLQSRELSHLAEELNTAKSLSEDIHTEFRKAITGKEVDISDEEVDSVEELMGGETSYEQKTSNILSNHKSSPVRELVSKDAEEVFDVDKSISESLADASSIEEPEDSLDEDVKRLSIKRKLLECDEEYESNGSFSLDKEVYNLVKNERKDAAPLINALQREGDSSVDQIWRSIADSAVYDATTLVISKFVNKTSKGSSFLPTAIAQSNNKLVGDSDDDEWDGEELQRQQAAEAEVLRLQQLRIDKEIEELEEEEARRFYYIRAIPDKPPPPYTPRRSSLVASVVEAAGEIWDGRSEPPAGFMNGCHLREFLWDLAAELVARVRPSTPPPQPPWVRARRRRPKRHIRTKEELLEEVEKEAKIYLGLEERECRENLIIRWSRKRRDHVDEILVKESQEEEWEWTDYSEEENIIKNRITDAIIQDSLAAATAAIAQAFVKKFKE